MIRRPPTAIPLRPEDITLFSDALVERKRAAAAAAAAQHASQPQDALASSSGELGTREGERKEGEEEEDEKDEDEEEVRDLAGLNMVQKRKEERKLMTTGERLGL